MAAIRSLIGKDLIHYARGSLCESINWIEKAIRRGFIDIGTGEKLLMDLTDISYKINYYIKSLPTIPTTSSTLTSNHPAGITKHMSIQSWPGT